MEPREFIYNFCYKQEASTRLCLYSHSFLTNQCRPVPEGNTVLNLRAAGLCKQILYNYFIHYCLTMHLSLYVLPYVFIFLCVFLTLISGTIIFITSAKREE